jgi:Acyl-CoA dehydrogenase, N-terminal domain
MANQAISGLLGAIEGIGPLIPEEAAAAEADRQLSGAVYQAMYDAGLFAMLAPKAYGGLELHPTECIRVWEALARMDAAAAWNLVMNQAIAAYSPVAHHRRLSSRKSYKAFRRAPRSSRLSRASNLCLISWSISVFRSSIVMHRMPFRRRRRWRAIRSAPGERVGGEGAPSCVSDIRRSHHRSDEFHHLAIPASVFRLGFDPGTQPLPARPAATFAKGVASVEPV